MSAIDDIPARIDLEEQLIGGLFYDPAVLDEMTFLRADDFFRASHAEVWRAIGRLKDTGRPIDPLTVDVELEAARVKQRPSADELMDLMGRAYHAANCVEYAGVIRELAMRRRIVAGMEEAMRAARRRDCSVAEALAAVQKVAYEAESFGGGRLAHISESLIAAIDRHDDRLAGKVDGIPTGLPNVDRIIGSMRAGQLIVLAARPSMGKTAFALNVARAAADRGEKTLFVSLEMESIELAERLIAAESGVSTSDGTPGVQTARVASLNRLNGLGVWVEDTPIQSVGMIAAAARRMKASKGLGLIVVDYLQLIDAAKDAGRDASRQEQVAYMSRRLKAMAKELDVPVLALAQLNRQSEARSDRIPQLADLRESGQIEQDADVVMMLHRPSFYDPNDEPGVAHVYVRKNRSGPTDWTRLEFNGALSRFDNFIPPALAGTF